MLQVNVSDLKNWLILKPKAEENMRDFFQKVAAEVLKLDKKNILMPPEINEKRCFMLWPFVKYYSLYEELAAELGYDEDEEEESESSYDEEEEYEDKEEYEEDYEEEEEEYEEEYEDEELEEEMEDKVIPEIGLYFWCPQKDEAALSLYVVVEGSSPEKSWVKTKEIARALNGDIFLFNPDWDENEIEIARFALTNGEINPQKVAQRVVDTAKKIIKIL